MIISHTHKFIFFKSEKTAGTSIETILSQYCSGDDIVVPINDFRHNRSEKGKFTHQSMNADEEYRKIGQHVDAETIRRKVSPEVWNNYFKFSIARNQLDRTISDFSGKEEMTLQSNLASASFTTLEFHSMNLHNQEKHYLVF